MQFAGQPAGDYELVIETVPPSLGTLTIIYPVATYDLRSQRNGRTITARAAAGESGVTLLSWQLD